MPAKFFACLLAMVVAGAGCVGLTEDRPVEAASTTAAEDAPATDGSDNATAAEEAPDSTEEPASEPQEGAAEPPAEADQEADNDTTALPAEPWALDGALGLGFVAAVGSPYTSETPVGVRETDETHCHRGMLVVPAGAMSLALSIEEPTFDAEAPGVGLYEVHLVAPNGTATVLAPDPAAAAGSQTLGATMPRPAEGQWQVIVEPYGPTVGRVWNVGVRMGGEGPAPTLSLVHACESEA